MALQCRIDASPKENEIIWTKDGLALTSESRLEIGVNKLTLSISPLQVVDDGEYQCVAVNPEGRGICHNPYQLTVVCKSTVCHTVTHFFVNNILYTALILRI